ncbi:MAG: alpha-L-fucosidase [Ginsengibacter sp.]
MKKLLVISIYITAVFTGFSQDSTHLRNDWKKMHDSKASLFKDYNDLKFGMFIHWGVYSKLGGVWKGVKIVPETHGSQATLGEWIMYSAEIPRAEYREVAKTFTPIDFNADEWVKLAKDAGMKYIVAMPKHHDGFAMYHSKVSDYNIYDLTPFKRDPIEELYKACKKYGLRMGIYYSHSNDWMDGGDCGIAQAKKANVPDFTTYGANTWDPSPVSYPEYIKNKAQPQMKELLKKFPDLVEVWYDYPRYMNEQQSFEFYKLAYDIQPKALINSRVGNDFGDYLSAGDNQIPTEINTKYKTWETPGTLNNTWGYKSYDHDWKSYDEMLFWVVEIASKGGNYLLNVGPDGNGVIPEESVKVLRAIGTWMKINGEAIYGTSRWITMKEGPTTLNMKSTVDRRARGFSTVATPEDFWFTKKGNNVYVISLVSPANKKVSVKTLHNYRDKIKNIYVLGKKDKLNWKVKNNKIDIALPATNEEYASGFVLKVAFK